MNPGQDARAGTGAGAAPAVLDINNIEVVYNKAVQVLRGLSLSVPAGSIVALRGSNGAGKSTAEPCPACWTWRTEPGARADRVRRRRHRGA